MRPVLFHIGPITVHSWGLMFMLGILAAILVGRWHLKDRGVNSNAIYGITLAAVAGGIIGARIFYIIGNWSQYAAHPLELLKFWNLDGLVFYGGLLGGALDRAHNSAAAGPVFQIISMAILLTASIVFVFRGKLMLELDRMTGALP